MTTLNVRRGPEFTRILGLGVARIPVRVVFHGLFAIGALQRLFVGSLVDTQNFVEITLAHYSSPVGRTRTAFCRICWAS